MIGEFYVIDSHCHIYPEKIASRAVAGTNKFYDTGSAGEGTVSDMIRRGKAAGVDHYIVQSVATTPKQVKSINEFIAREVEENNGLLTGLGTLHPESEDIAGDVEYAASLGLKGIKLHPDIQKFRIDDYRCLKIYDECERRGLPILMHTGDHRYDYSNPNRLKPVLDIYKNLTVIGAHFGGWSIWEKACEQLKGTENLYVDCSSAMPYLDDGTIVRIIRSYGADKVLFGTDYPMWEPKDELKRFMSLDLDENEKRCILGLNAKKLFGID